MTMRLVFLLPLLMVVVLGKVRENLVVIVAAGSRDCYFFSVSAGDWINVDYQVTSAGGVTGNFDLKFELIDPHGDSVHLEQEGDFGQIESKARLDGDYQICLDNSASTVSEKSVYLSVGVTDPSDGYYEWDLLQDEKMRLEEHNFDKTLDGFDPEKTFPLFRAKMLALHKSLSESARIQSMMDASYTQDLQMASANGEKIAFWSLIHLFLVLIVGSIQVGLLKSLFSRDNRLVHRLMTPKTSNLGLNKVDDNQSSGQFDHVIADVEF